MKLSQKIIAMFVLLSLVLIAGCSEETNSNSMNNGSNISTNNTTGTKERSSAIYNMNEDAKLGDLIINVSKAEKSAGDKNNKPKDGNEYIIVTLSMLNSGKTNINYNEIQFGIQNSQGQVTNSEYVSIDNNKRIDTGELVENGKVQGELVFEVPQNDNGLILRYKNYDNTEVNIKLNQVTTKPVNTPVQQNDINSIVITCAKSLVLDNLKSPATAQWGSSEIVSKDNYGRYLILLTVDAQNSFGALIRSKYYVVLQSVTADGHYTYNKSYGLQVVSNKMTKEQQEELMKSLNGWNKSIESPKNSTQTTDNSSSSKDYIFSDSGNVLLNESALRNLSKEKLAIARNEIYARHGYIFTTQLYKDYFNSKSWYVPNPSFKGTDDELNEVELANTKLIKKVEDSK